MCPEQLCIALVGLNRHPNSEPDADHELRKVPQPAQETEHSHQRFLASTHGESYTAKVFQISLQQNAAFSGKRCLLRGQYINPYKRRIKRDDSDQTP